MTVALYYSLKSGRLIHPLSREIKKKKKNIELDENKNTTYHKLIQCLGEIL